MNRVYGPCVPTLRRSSQWMPCAWLVALVVFGGCGSQAHVERDELESADSGSADSGSDDTGSGDTGVIDSGAIDSGGASDASTDSGVPATETCLSRPPPYTVISGIQTARWDQRSSLPANRVVDARTASWTTDLTYPALAGAGDALCWHGGRIIGTFPDSATWDFMHGTAALEWFGGAGSIVEDLYVENYGDSIKVKQSADNFVVRRLHAKHLKDDCIENDFVRTGTLKDSLLEGCYSGISARPGSAALSTLTEGRNHVFTIENVLLWLEPMQQVYAGTSPNTSGFFKWDKSSYDTSPKVILRNNVFRADMKPADGNICLSPVAYSPKVIESTNNTVVWLGGGEYPCLPLPAGWTLTTDRAVWDKAVSSWKAAHPGL